MRTLLLPCDRVVPATTMGGLVAGTAHHPHLPSPLQNLMFLGDFNADCSYVQPSDWSSIRLRTSDIFKWLIPDSADTTVGKSDCAYDRSALPP